MIALFEKKKSYNYFYLQETFLKANHLRKKSVNGRLRYSQLFYAAYYLNRKFVNKFLIIKKIENIYKDF